MKDAQDKLQSLINDPTSTAKNIEGATKTLITATATAKSLRDDANDTAETTIDGVQNDDVANEPSVQAAIDRLRDVMNEAAANNENNLTVDIQRATDDLKTAITAANTSRQTAVDATKHYFNKQRHYQMNRQLVNRQISLMICWMLSRMMMFQMIQQPPNLKWLLRTYRTHYKQRVRSVQQLITQLKQRLTKPSSQRSRVIRPYKMR